MKKTTSLLALLVTLIMAVALFAGCGSSGGGSAETTAAGGGEAAGGEVIELSLTFHDSAEALKTQYVQKWADQVEEVTEGKVHVTVYAGGTLAAATDALDAVKNGTADIGVCFTSFFPGQFPLSEVISLPMLGIDNAVQATNILWDLWESEEAMQAELAPYKVIMLYSGPNNPICTNGTPVHSMNDMKGLKLRVSSGTPSDMAQAWGATPIALSSAELYQSMEKGTIDGYMIDFTGVNAWNLIEVTDYYTEFPFYVQPWCVLMNMDSWNKIPADLQEKINSVSGREMSLGFGQLNEDESNDTKAKIKEGGAEVYNPTDDELATFKPAAEEYVAAWVTNNTKDGFDGQAFVDKVMELAEKYKQ